MRIVDTVADAKFLKLKRIVDEDNNVNGYVFAERKGIDSVAFIGYNMGDGHFLLNREYTPPTGDFKLRAFGGSLDKSISKIEIVQDEILEEAGFNIDKESIYNVGRAFVSTQMNQFVYLYSCESESP